MSERAQVILQVVVVVGVMLAAMFGLITSVATETPAVTSPTFAPPDESLIVSTLTSPPVATPSPTATFATLPPTPPPTPTPPPIQMRAYALSGKTYTNVVAPVGAVFIAPFEARVQVVYYQIIDGEFYTGTDLADRPHYPYVFLYTSDGRVMKFRPGATGTDSEVLVSKDNVVPGDDLFRITGTGPSSWHFRYDSTVTDQVVVSLETSGLADLDAAPFIRAR